MIKAKPKPLEEIQNYVESYDKILVIGCGGCVSVCLAGGQKEVNILRTELELAYSQTNTNKHMDGYTVERQCNSNLIEELDPIVADFDCIISMACGAGVQHLAERYPGKPVFPAVNTIAIGIDLDIGLYEERCRACGECVLAYTAGICPVTRCAKGLFNGPCGGTNGENCEISNEIDCAWLMIYHRLKEQNRLEDILKIQPPMEWKNQVKRTIIQKGYENRYIEK
jgi:ferredoxin